MKGNSQLSDRQCTSAPIGTFVHPYVDVDDPGSGTLDEGHCINKFNFIGRANDNCQEGMIFDNVAPYHEPDLQLRIESYYAIFRDPSTNEALNPHTNEKYHPYVPRDLVHTGIRSDLMGYKYLPISMNTPKDSRNSDRYWCQSTYWGQYYGGATCKEQQQLPMRWAFWKGVGPQAVKVTVPWIQLTFYDFDDLAADSMECVTIVGAWQFSRWYDPSLNLSLIHI